MVCGVKSKATLFLQVDLSAAMRRAYTAAMSTMLRNF